MVGSVLLSARRSPIVPRNGAFAALSIEEIAAPIVLAALNDAGLAVDEVDELIAANSLGAGGNPARITALHAGLPERVAGLTIDRQCVGGLDAILLADALVRSGRCDVVVAGGVESYSRMPLRFKTFSDARPPEQFEQAQFTPWPDRDPDMAQAANQLAVTLGISKAEQDAWAITSHQAARSAPVDHIVELLGVSNDPFTRELSERHCARAPKVSGSISVANMSVAADGAAFVVVVSSQWAKERCAKGVDLLGGQTIGGNPEMPGLAPVEAINQTLSSLNICRSDLRSVEIMEAFAAQAIACVDGAGIDPVIVNNWGGSLARGHPIGASGAVLAVQLFHRIQVTGGLGMAAIAAAGGLGSAIALSL